MSSSSRQCKESRNASQGSCCCTHCEHDRITPVEGYCCNCVPRKLCVVFQPNDDYDAPTEWTMDHLGEGLYTVTLSTGIDLTVTLRRGTETGTSTSSRPGECYWEVFLDASGTANDFLDEYFVYLNGQRETGCLTEDGDSISFDYTFLSVPGQFTIAKARQQVMPIERQEDGCLNVVCADCECFPACVCLVYRIGFFVPDEDRPNDPVENTGNIYRSLYACWDESAGANGGWVVEFSENFITSCADSLSGVIEWVEKEDGTCEMVLTTDDGAFDMSPGLFDPAQPDCTELYNLWEWGTVDASPTGTGQIVDSGTASLPLILRQLTLTTAVCDTSCLVSCCENLPDTLLVTITSPGEGCILNVYEEFEITRDNCANSTYSGTFVDGIEWDCTTEGEGAGYGDVSIAFNCSACEWNYDDGKCECDCDAENVTPVTQKCHRMGGITFSDWECYNPADCSHGGIGGVSNRFGRCGNDGGTSEVFYNTCDPIYYDSDNFDVVGVGMCCDTFRVIITEVPG